jgi:hypothetical protein
VIFGRKIENKIKKQERITHVNEYPRHNTWNSAENSHADDFRVKDKIKTIGYTLNE